ERTDPFIWKDREELIGIEVSIDRKVPDAEALSRLKTFCGMTVSVRLVASKGSFQAQMARLEAAGVDVQAYDPWGKGAAV
ncbi:MAG: hypothetical protein J6U63_00695, partial [Clostridia bacterium]|nr:hypothetical protein [Clostridia bacterium]